MACPNLFNFATSELSQDAFLSWLLSWSDTQYAEKDSVLHGAGYKLLNAILGKHGEQLSEPSAVAVHKQHKRIDIVAIVDDRLALLIEDKVHAGVHGNQLERYRKLLADDFPHCKILPTFIKTGDQSDYKVVEAAGYQLLLRDDLLNILRSERQASATSDIFHDYLEQLEKLDADVRSFANLSIRDWCTNAWVGFYKQLQLELAGLNWDYVANASGGFLGAWWYFKEWQNCDVYLQIEQGTLCFKIAADQADKTKASELRDRWHNRLMMAAQHLKLPLLLARPKRFGVGTTMTVAIAEQAAWMAETSNGSLDMVATLGNLQLAEQLLDAARLSEAN